MTYHSDFKNLFHAIDRQGIFVDNGSNDLCLTCDRNPCKFKRCGGTKYVYKSEPYAQLRRAVCPRCGHSIPIGNADMAVLDDGGKCLVICRYCKHNIVVVKRRSGKLVSKIKFR